jgi:hypothetical protein
MPGGRSFDFGSTKYAPIVGDASIAFFERCESDCGGSTQLSKRLFTKIHDVAIGEVKPSRSSKHISEVFIANTAILSRPLEKPFPGRRRAYVGPGFNLFPMSKNENLSPFVIAPLTEPSAFDFVHRGAFASGSDHLSIRNLIEHAQYAFSRTRDDVCHSTPVLLAVKIESNPPP